MKGFPVSCPHCGHDKSDVVDKRGAFRRRECKGCGRRFSTREILDRRKSTTGCAAQRANSS